MVSHGTIWFYMFSCNVKWYETPEKLKNLKSTICHHSCMCNGLSIRNHQPYATLIPQRSADSGLPVLNTCSRKSATCRYMRQSDNLTGTLPTPPPPLPPFHFFTRTPRTEFRAQTQPLGKDLWLPLKSRLRQLRRVAARKKTLKMPRRKRLGMHHQHQHQDQHQEKQTIWGRFHCPLVG